MKKTEIMEKLKEAGIAFKSTMSKEELETMLPVEVPPEEETPVEEMLVPVEETAAPEGLVIPDDARIEVSPTKVEGEAVDVFDRAYVYVRTYSKKEQGDEYVKLAETFIYKNQGYSIEVADPNRKDRK